MIEVEKKVEVSSLLLSFLKENARFLGREKIQDVYFDKDDFFYTKKNIWLRKRNNKFELKQCVVGNNNTIDRYEEITDNRSIANILSLNNDLSLKNLSNNKIFPFAEFYSIRDSYQINDLKIDVDSAHFKDFTYSIAEVECMVSSEDEIKAAEDKILNFLSSFNISVDKKLFGKLIAYLHERKPFHYRALKNANVVF